MARDGGRTADPGGHPQAPNSPLKRLGTSEEIAWWVAMLASPAGDYVTGQTLIVDGGKTLWGDYWLIPDPDELPEVVIPKEPWEG